MSSNKETREELPELLRGLRGRGDGLSSPDEAYFGALAGRSLEAARAPARRRSLARWMASAAAILLLLAAGWWLSGNPSPEPGLQAGNQTPSSEELLDQLTAEDIDAYIDDKLYDFEDELYAEAPINQ